MNYEVELTDHFKKEAKRLLKKYHSLKAELSSLFETLETNPAIGIQLTNDVYKIRLAIASKGKGKSGGARIITYVKTDNSTILILSIYNKGDKESISEKEIQELLNKYVN